MTSGKPFSDREIAFVRAHLHEQYPSVIARALGQYYPEDNGGSRGTKAVSKLMQKLRDEQCQKTELPAQTAAANAADIPRSPQRNISSSRRR